MRLTIKLKGEAATELAKRAPASPDTESLLAATRAARAELRPTHPGADDVELRTWFHADVGDETECGRLLERLRAEPAVESAFVKPPDEPP